MSREALTKMYFTYAENVKYILGFERCNQHKLKCWVAKDEPYLLTPPHPR